ncbi:sulfur dehydrogenase subunit SoxD [Octadecabacter temperatus]|uniref:Cytochrome c2 n=1 Tax=Octadecabacter temperatus TaxID=1458307 RepID=A0A0K0Y4F6_9RHOB|nr:c-type cytochrome [Octadecabacter temperatus]AKS45878.1 Cytochrome c2 [Octadecabacter temperatus]SIO02609.1 sulfur dehydrogenase subunit SoxD [Octadecabacter temperatus]
MSKSLNLFLPAIGGTALMLGGAYGFTSRDYAEQKIESLEIQVEQSTASAADAVANARAAEAEIEVLAAERDELQVIAAAGGGLTQPAPVAEAVYGLGREALPEEIAAWDVDILPDGRGLPVGSGDVWTGEEIFVEQCAACHGDFAEGSGNWPVLAGGFGTLSDEDPVKTIGSYWPYLSTSWDYINRSMPFGNAGTLSADDTYAIVAYILYSNDLIDDDFVLSNETFMDVELPNAGGFVLDDRADTEYTVWRAEPCMTGCKEGVEITMHASVVDVTPETEEEAAAEEAAVVTEPAVEGAAVETEAAVDPALIEAGQSAFRQCSACHEVGENASNRTGPELNGLLGRSIGSIDGFRYSSVMSDAGEAGDTWTAEALDAFLTDPRGVMSGTKMAFRGVRNPEDIAAIIAYIQSVGSE